MNIKKDRRCKRRSGEIARKVLYMNDIILTRKNDCVTADSRQIAEHFGKRHDNVVRDLESLKKDVLNFEEMFFQSTYADSYGRQQKSYLMTRDGFTLLVMGFTGKAALEWKLKYIKAFNEMEKSLIDGSPSYQITDPIERAKAWIKEQEEKKELAEQINQLAPKALFADAVSVSNTSILVGELAKLIKQNGVDIGQNRLFDWLRNNGHLIRRQGTDYNMPTQRSMEMGLFEVKETVITHSDGHTSINKTPKVTGRGQIYFIQKFLGGEAV